MEDFIEHTRLTQTVTLTEEDLTVLRTVAEAMSMGAAAFLTAEVQGTSAEDARAYLKGFVAHADAVQLRTIYYLTRILTESGRR